MKSIYKIFLLAVAVVGLMVMEGCANAHVSAGMGVNVAFGPNGPRVVPTMDVNVYSGGNFY